MQRREAEGPRAKQGPAGAPAWTWSSCRSLLLQGPVDLWTQATNDVWAYGRVEV
jgi:hypothetical protein